MATDILDATDLALILNSATGDDKVAIMDALSRLLLAAGSLPALPSLPLAAGTALHAIGDSQIGYNGYQGNPATTQALGINSQMTGFITHAQAIAPRFRFFNWWAPSDINGRGFDGGNQGVFSDHMTTGVLGGIVGRLALLLARVTPKVIVLQGGLNSINSGDDPAQPGVPSTAEFAIAKMNLALAMCRKAGVWVILVPPYPTGLWTAGDKRYARLEEYRQWCIAQKGRNGVFDVMNIHTLLAPSGVMDTTLFQSDLSHLNIRGAVEAALYPTTGFVDIMKALITDGTPFFDQNPATSNILTVAQGEMVGTAGSKTGTPAVPTGNVATGYTVNLNRNASSIFCSKRVITGTREAQTMLVTPANDTPGSLYGQAAVTIPTVVGSAFTSVIAQGDWMQVYVFVELIGAEESFSMARLNTKISQASTTVAATVAMNTSSGAFNVKTKAGRGFWLISEPLQAPAVAFDRTTNSIDFYWDKAGPPFTIEVSHAIVRKIANPKPDWGYAA